MSLLTITLSETGVLRVDVFVQDAEEYPHAAKFHQELIPEIDRLDSAIKEKSKRAQAAYKGH